MNRLLRLLQDNLRDARAFGPAFVKWHWAAARGRKEHSWNLDGIGRVSVRLGTTDIDVFRQIFQWREYDMSRWKHYKGVLARYEAILAAGGCPIIIDAGANIGASALWFAREFPRAQVVAVEPDPDNAAACRANVAAHQNIVLHEAAIGSAPGRIELYNPARKAWAARARRSETGDGIDVVTIPELVASVPDGTLFIVKIDIEGFESDLFASNIDWINEAAAILIETHDWMMCGAGSSATLQKAMGDRRFEIVVSGENLVYFNSLNPRIG